MEQVSTSPSLQRTILRLVQQAGQIERSALGLRSRSYDPENWDAVLVDLMERGLITEDAQIRVGEKSMRQQRRAVIVYRLTDIGMQYPDFGSISTEECNAFVEKFRKQDLEDDLAAIAE
jgi:hypothetical protein